MGLGWGLVGWLLGWGFVGCRDVPDGAGAGGAEGGQCWRGELFSFLLLYLCVCNAAVVMQLLYHNLETFSLLTST